MYFLEVHMLLSEEKSEGKKRKKEKKEKRHLKSRVGF